MPWHTTYLVEVSLQVVNLLAVLEQTGPVLLLELLLAQYECDIAAAVVDLGLFGVDLGVELDVNGVCDFLGR